MADTPSIAGTQNLNPASPPSNEQLAQAAPGATATPLTITVTKDGVTTTQTLAPG